MNTDASGKDSRPASLSSTTDAVPLSPEVQPKVGSGTAMPRSALEAIAVHAEDGAALRRAFFAAHAPAVRDAALNMALALARGHKILLCGNGGSAADAQHLAGELVNRFLLDRPPLPAVALTTDSSVLTAIANDFGYEQIFAKQVQALGQPGDVLVAISTSGNSPNVLAALEEARKRHLFCIGLSAKGGGGMAQSCDVLLDVPHHCTPLIQEVHITIGHLLCQLVDHYLFENVAELTRAAQQDP